MAEMTYTLRKDAQRGAARMIAKGSAPCDRYTVDPVGTRFAIFWKVSKTPEEIEAEAFTPKEAAAPHQTNDEAEADSVAAARGEMPALPTLDAPSAAGYKARAEKMQAMALANDWSGVEQFQLTANNTYTKVLKTYRQRLLAAHQAQLSSATG